MLELTDDNTAVMRHPECKCGLPIQTQTCTDNPSLCCFALITIRFISLFQSPAVSFTSLMSSLVTRVLRQRSEVHMAFPYRHSQPTSCIVVQRFAFFFLFTFIYFSCATLLHTTDQVIYELDLKKSYCSCTSVVICCPLI